jgi:hypothetical protein
MFSNHKTQRAFRFTPPVAMHARAQKKEISFALVPMEETAGGAAGPAGRRSATTST